MILTALKKYKKTILELLKQLKKSFKKNRKQYYIGFSITGLLILSFVSFLIFRIKPNDDIFVAGSEDNALYLNINPKFNVSFGQKEDTSKQWIRFESKSTVENPFNDENVGFFKKIFDSITPKDNLGVEMSLTGVEIGETAREKTGGLDDRIQTVAEILGTEEIRTNTELVEMGREIGKSEGDQIISKETIVNPNVDDGIDLEYQILPGVGLKEEIVLRDLSSFNKECLEDINKCKLPLNEFYFDLKLDEGVRLKKGWYTVNGKSTVAYYFVDEKDRYLSHFLPSFAVDDRGVKTFDVDLKIDETKDEDIYKISVIVDLEWLLSSERVFPIRIDPSIVHDTKNEFDGGIFDRTESFDGARVEIKQPNGSSIDSNTVGYWNLEEESGSGAYLLDSSSNGNNGTPTGTNFREGKINGFREFGGTDYITIPDSNTLDLTSAVTLEAWIKPSSLLDLQTIVCKRNVSQYNYCLRLTGANIEFFFIGAGTTHVAGTSNSPIKLNEWQNVVATYDSSQVKIYIDGILQNTSCTSGTCNVAMTTDSTPLVIGRAGDVDSQYFLGYIDEVGVSSIARSKSEIMRSYTSGLEKYFGGYKSSEISMGNSSNIESLSWTENGSGTGNGETPYSTTGLVAQWNFNETSGTTAVSGGSCGTSCNGTLTNMTTTGQDAAVGTGWTYDNRKWGQGALMFDGSNDYVAVPSNSGLNSLGDFSVSLWLKTGRYDFSTPQTIIYKTHEAEALAYPYLIKLENKYLKACRFDGRYDDICLQAPYTDSDYHNIVYSKNGSTLSLYMDGVLVGTTSDTTDFEQANSGILYIGSGISGIIDAVQIYSRSLTTSEILSNYQAGDIEFRYRISNDGNTWSSWNGGSESEIETFNQDYLYDPTVEDIVAYYPMDENVDNSCSGGEDVCNRKTTSLNGTSTGSTISDGKFGKGRSFNGTNNFVSLPASSSFDLQTFTIDAWVYSDNFNRNMHVFEKTTNGNVNTQYSCFFNNNNTFAFRTFNSSSVQDDLTFTTGTYFENGAWNHVACVYDGVTKAVYVNGYLVASKAYTQTLITNPSGTSIIGAYGSGTGFFFNGSIDELTIMNKALSAEYIHQRWVEGSTNSGTVKSNTSTISMDSNSMHIDKSLQVKGNTLGSWSFDEVSGTGAYIKDESGHGADLTPSNTTYVKGRDEGALSFNGTNSNAKASSSSYVNASGDISVEMWLYPTSWATNNRTILGKLSQFSLQIDTNGYIAWADSSDWSYANFGFQNIGLKLNKWQHLVVTKSGSTVTIYLDGVQKVSKAFGSAITTTSNIFHVGCYSDASACTGYYYSGYIDDLNISSFAIPYNEVAERYRAGQYHTINKQLDEDFNFNGKTTIPFWIASDELGNNIDLIYGNDKYANYIADSNTIGYWKMDEENGSGAYIKDSSGHANHGTPTSTTSVGGKFGKARSFTASANYINVGSTSEYGGLTDLTIDAWIYPTTITGEHRIFDRGVTGTPNLILFYQSGAQVRLTINNTDTISTTNVLTANQWYHIVATYDGGGGEKAIYVNGIKVVSGTTTQSSTTAGAIASLIGCSSSATCSSTYAFNGNIDELRLSNTIRQESDIRSAYEIGKRTHPVNIEFKADLQSSNLISSSGDTSFTISEIGYGTTDDIENLNTGDKIVVKENYNGTEYIAQGEVSTKNVDTGLVTVNSWDSMSTFPSGGFTINASVFKWQMEVIDIRGLLYEQKNRIGSLVFRFPTGTPANFWIDEMKLAKYLTNIMGITDEQLEALDSSGETLVDDTNLFAQWNFNDTNGNTLDTGSGSCGASCDGTLSGFSNTSGRDVATASGWTGIFNRWGSGGLMLDGTNDYVNVGDVSAIDTADSLSVCSWVNPNSDTDDDFILSKVDPADNSAGIMLLRDDIGQSSGRTDLYKIHVSNGVTLATIESSTGSGKSNEWTHVCFTYTDNSSTGLRLYVNGVEDVNSPVSTVGINDFDSNNTNLTIGRYDPTGTGYFNGVIDSTSIFARVLTASEISQNYSVGYQESVLGMEGTSSRAIKGNVDNDPDLIFHYTFDETNGDLTGDDIFDSSGNDNHGEISGSGLATAVVDGVIGNAREFNGSDDNVKTSNYMTYSTTNGFTFSTWIFSDGSASSMTLLSHHDVGKYGFEPMINSSNQILFRSSPNGSSLFSTNTSVTVSTGVWTHLVFIINNYGRSLYKNGEFVWSDTNGYLNVPTSLPLTIGMSAYNSANNAFFNGKMDDIRLYERSLTSREVYNLYSLKEGKSDNITIPNKNLTSYNKIPLWVAGDKLGKNYQLTYGESAYANYQPDRNTVGLWHMDENNGGRYVIESFKTVGTRSYTIPTGVTKVDVLVVGGGGAGGSNVGLSTSVGAGGGGAGGVKYTSGFSVTPGTSITVTVGGGGVSPASAGKGGNGGSSVFGSISVSGGGGGGFRNGAGLSGASGGGGSYNYAGGAGISGEGYRGGNGTSNNYGAPGGGGAGAIGTDSPGLNIGRDGGVGVDYSSVFGTGYGASGWFGGGGGGGGRDTYAAGAGGTGGGGTGGSNANGSTATANTGGGGGGAGDTWRGGSGASGIVLIKYWVGNVDDSSNSKNIGFANGPTSAEGKISNSWNFDGINDYIAVLENDTLDPSSITIDAWIKINRYADGNFVNKGDNNGYRIKTLPNGTIRFHDRGSTNYITTISKVPKNQWVHIAVTGDSTGLKIYVNGNLESSNSTPYGGANTTSDLIFGHYASTEWFGGLLDEVRISNVARSAEEIRQAYEVGFRTKDVDIEFKADLQSGNLISDSDDKSFSISETEYGSTEEIENLSEGDNIIIYENYGGIEYKAQGEIETLNTNTGLVTVTSWKEGSTFPSNGYTINATVFKWQRVYLDLWGSTNLEYDNDSVTNITVKKINDNGSNLYIDDIRAGEELAYLGSTKYFQYDSIFTTYDSNITPYLSSVQIDYSSSFVGPTNEQLMRHGKWFDSNGAKQNFWWIDSQ